MSGPLIQRNKDVPLRSAARQGWAPLPGQLGAANSGEQLAPLAAAAPRYLPVTA